MLLCLCLLWIWADSEQLHVNECSQLAVIVRAGAMELSVNRAQWFPMRVFCVPLNRRDSPGCRCHTKIIKIQRRDEYRGRLLVFMPEKAPKQQSVSLAFDNDLSVHRCGWQSTALKPWVSGCFFLF